MNYMKVDKILRCICSPDDEDTGSIYYGMPILKVTDNSEFWEAVCPKCGRGGSYQYKSPYLALKAWNAIQTRLPTIGQIFEGIKGV